MKVKSSLRLKRKVVRRYRYQMKRKTDAWKKRKIIHYAERSQRRVLNIIQSEKEFINLSAPINYSFIRNTNEVLKYFNDASQIFNKRGNVNFDISKIETLTPDAIALHVSTITNSSWSGCVIKGNYPEKEDLNQLFTQSGFQRFVHTSRKKAKTDGNFLHREKHYKVEPLIAKNAALAGIRHSFGNERPYEPLYDILIECMSNTNNHATMSKDKTHWWLYVYNNPITFVTSYSFLDLGVGIFKSIELQDYYQTFIKNLFKGKFIYKHIDIVDDLLGGKIQSRIDEDHEIRGKGIPQIVEHSKRSTFKEFYIISNDIKVNLKNNQKEELKYNFRGTFLYWEIQKTK